MILSKYNLSDFQTWYSEAQTNGAMILVDKDKDWTSFDVVAKIRGLTRIKKIGHAGTLDPLATGLLILCLGKFTKKINEFQDFDKSYTALVKLGATTASDDSEFEEENITETDHLQIDTIKETILKFVGDITQYPPKFSAKKVDGKRLYKLARKNIDVEIKPIQVKIHKIEIKEISLPYLTIDILCSKGTYIRSLARDIGKELGVGAYMADLRRNTVGDFSVESALKISDIVENIEKLKQENESL